MNSKPLRKKTTFQNIREMMNLKERFRREGKLGKGLRMMYQKTIGRVRGIEMKRWV